MSQRTGSAAQAMGIVHAHTVPRRPRSDFGADVLAAHYAQAHP